LPQALRNSHVKQQLGAKPQRIEHPTTPGFTCNFIQGLSFPVQLVISTAGIYALWVKTFTRHPG